MHLGLMARDPEKPHVVAESLTKMLNSGVRVVAGDPRDLAVAVQAVAEAVGHFGRLDVPVNNASARRRADFFAMTEEDWRRGFVLAFHGYVRIMQAFWPSIPLGGGSIVSIAGTGLQAESAEFNTGGSVNCGLQHFYQSNG